MICIEGSIPLTAVTGHYHTDDPKEAVKRFADDYPLGRVDAIDGRAVRGICNCGQPVMHTDKPLRGGKGKANPGGYVYDTANGVYVCGCCVAKTNKNWDKEFAQLAKPAGKKKQHKEHR